MTYRLLIVDDEAHAIEGVKADLDVENLGISELYTAFNIRKAKDILASGMVDILLCDIEMPKGSGLELLTWVKEHHPRTVTIFLTSHADFKYAKEALRLGSLEYLLKPVLASELDAVIRKAQQVIEQHSEISRNSQSHQLWVKHHSLIIERFWLDLLTRTLPSTPETIRELVERNHIPISSNSLFLPVLISVQNWNKDLQIRGEKIMEYALKKTAEEMMTDKGNGIVIPLDNKQMLVLFVSDRHELWDYSEMKEVFRNYIHFCNRHFFCALSCYFGKPVEAHQVADKVTFLKSLDLDNVAFVNQVHGEEEMIPISESVILPDLNVWLSLLKNGTKESVVQGMGNVLNDLAHHKMMNAEILHQLHQDFLQALYSYLNLKEIQAHQLFGDVGSKRMNEKAGRSFNDMMDWVRYAVNKALLQAEVVKEAQSVVEIVKRYVAANIDQDLTREVLSEQVYLNVDHLSRIFKKETGYTLADYVLVERIKLAKHLLIHTTIQVSAVASSVGHSNFSHFTKIFKKYVGMLPSEFRSKYEQDLT